jgi:prophage regulatory protein
MAMSQAELSRKALALIQASSPAGSTGGTPRDDGQPAIVRTILRMPQVQAATGLKQSHIYDLIAQGKFPRGVKLSAQATGWFADEVADWQQSRPRAEGGWSPRDRKRQSAPEAA